MTRLLIIQQKWICEIIFDFAATSSATMKQYVNDISQLHHCNIISNLFILSAHIRSRWDKMVKRTQQEYSAVLTRILDREIKRKRKDREVNQNAVPIGYPREEGMQKGKRKGKENSYKFIMRQ